MGVTVQESVVMDRLATVDLFRGLSRRELKRLATMAHEVDHRDGHDAVAEGHRGVGFHLILEGSATVTVGGVQRRTLGPGDHFGEISLLDGLPRSASVTAQGSLRTLYVPRDEFSALIDEHPEICRTLLTVLCTRLRSLEQD
jgi:CRP-like cAMP-binding protein